MDASGNPSRNRRGGVQKTQGPLEETSLSADLLGVIWARRWLLVFFALLGAAFGAFGAAMSKDVYQVEGSLLYRFDREYLGDDSAFDRWRGDGIRIDAETAIHTDLEILGSHRLLGMTLDRVGPAPAMPAKPLEAWLDRLSAPAAPPVAAPAKDETKPGGLDRQRAITAFRRDLSIRRVQGTNVANISFQHQNPEWALLALDTLLDLYLAERRVLLDRESGKALAHSLAGARAELAAAEAARIAFVAERGLESPEGRLAELQSERDSLRAALNGENPATGVPDATLSPRLAQVEEELRDLEADARKLAALAEDVTLKREAAAWIARLLQQQKLSEQVQATSASPIFLLDVPALQPDPVGLSASKKTALSAIAGLMIGALLVLLQDHLGIRWAGKKTHSVDGRPSQ